MKRFPFTIDRLQGVGAGNWRINGLGGWTVITVLALLLVAAGVIGYLGWTLSDAEVPVAGYVAMALGVVFSLACGVGLMALVFYSSRAGYDKPVELIREPDEAKEAETKP
jgi:hypothetical protein